MRIGYKSVLSYDGVRSSWSDPALLTSPWVMESLCSLLCGTAGILKTLRVHCLTLLSRFKIYFISDTDGDPRQNLGLESPHRSAWEQSLVCLINGVCAIEGHLFEDVSLVEYITVFQLRTCHCRLRHTQLTVHVSQAHKLRSMLCSPAPCTRKHRHSTGPKEPGLQKGCGAQRRSWYRQPASATSSR